MQALIFVHNDDVDKANEIAEKFGGPQAKNTFSVPYDKDWFIACWTMESNLYNELKNAGLCIVDYKNKKELARNEEYEKVSEKSRIISKEYISINTREIIASIEKQRLVTSNDGKVGEQPKGSI